MRQPHPRRLPICVPHRIRLDYIRVRLRIRTAHMYSILSPPHTSLLGACWTLECIPCLLATHCLHLISDTATSAHDSCGLRAVRLRRLATFHFFPHTRPPDTHALEVGAACLEYQGSLVNTYCTSALQKSDHKVRLPKAKTAIGETGERETKQRKGLPQSGSAQLRWASL